MKNQFENMEEILDSCIPGLHQYCLQSPVHLTYLSQSFCEMTGYSEQELLNDSADMYAALVHPADKALYENFIQSLVQKKQTLAAQYRIVKKDGTIMHISDTVTVKPLSNGVLAGYSVLTDITPIKAEIDNLRFLSETIPCGFIRYTCQKQPRVTYINEEMQRMLRFPEVKDGELDYLELYKSNIFLMIPMEDRRRFAHFLNRVYALGAPIAGEIAVQRCDGTRAQLFGWVTKCKNAQGEDEYQSVCMDITEKYQSKKASETERYLKALTEVYDKIFEYDLANKTVKCLYGQKSDLFRFIENIPMQLEEATGQWIEGAVFEEDRPAVHKFFSDFCQRRTEGDSLPPQIKYRALSSKGVIRKYTGIFLKIDSNVSLFCCRNISDTPDAEILRSENDSLRNLNENMHELVMHFTDGIAAFEVIGDYVTPMYASDNVCEFFGFTKSEWLQMMKRPNSIKTFVSRSGVAYEDFLLLLQKGEAEFTYFDISSKSLRRIKAICSQKSADGTSPRYVMLYNVSENSTPEPESADSSEIFIRTFGYFDVFVGDKPIPFRNKKSKELFALLVDRRGGYVTSEEAISFLWEDEPVSQVTLARYRKVALRLKNILEEYGIADIVESIDGKRRIANDKVKCDLYDYLSGKEEHSQLFKGSYLTNYSWGETTLGELLGTTFSGEN